MKPFASNIQMPEGLLEPHNHQLTRRLSSMKDQYHDQAACQTLLERDDTVIYEVYENRSPEREGDLTCGTSIIHAGKVGNEYFMTKGHYHQVLETAEICYCLKGYGCLMMETPQGEWSVEQFSPGQVIYIPPQWAHRLINVGRDDLIVLSVYPANAGHDYAAIETTDFRKLIIEYDYKPTIIDNPRWQGNGD